MSKRERTDNLEPATSSTYIQWVLTDKLHMDEEDIKKYNFLINELAKIEFVWSHPMDEKRAIDGLRFREDFTYETGYFLDKSSGLTPKCSMFELLAGIADKIEKSMMIDVNIGPRPGRWFIIFIKNLGLDECTNVNWKYDYEQFIKNTCIKFMDRGYEPNGVGGAFPLAGEDINIRQEDFWRQCSIYFARNYISK